MTTQQQRSANLKKTRGRAPLASLRRAQDFFAEGNPRAAIRCLEAIAVGDRLDLFDEEDQVRCLILLGRSLRETEQLADSEKFLCDAVRKARAKAVSVATRCDALRSYGEILCRTDRDKQASLVLRQAERLLTDDVPINTRCEVLLALGDALNYCGHERAAENRFRRAIAWLDESGVRPITRCNLFLGLAAVLDDQGKTSVALESAERAAAIAEQTPLSKLARCGVFRRVGSLLEELHRLEEAEVWLRKAAKLVDGRTKGVATQFTASLTFGTFLQDSGRHHEAERWLRQAVELSKLASISPYQLYSGRVALAETLESLEQFDAAEVELTEALALTEQPPCTPDDKYFVLMQLAEFYDNHGKEAVAEQYSRRLVDLVSLPGFDVCQRGPAMLSLGKLLLAQHKYVDAECWLRKAMTLIRQLPDIADQFDILYSLGEVLNAQQQHKEAEKLVRKAVKLVETNPDESNCLCKGLLELGEITAAQGSPVEAERHFLRGLELAETTDVDDEERFNAYTMFGTMLQELGRQHEAEEQLRNALKVVDEAGLDHQSRCTVLVSLAHCLDEQDRNAESESLVVQVDAIIDQGIELDPLTECSYQLLMGELMRKKGSLSDAESHFRRAAELAEAYTLGPLMLLNAASTMVDVLSEQGRHSEARQWQQKNEMLLQKHDSHPLARCNALLLFGQSAIRAGRRPEALRHMKAARDLWLSALAQNRWQSGVSRLSSMYRPLFELAQGLCESIWDSSGRQAKYLWLLVEFVDSERCIVIREGLRRQIAMRPSQVRRPNRWKSNGEQRSRLFGDFPQTPSRGATGGVRQIAVENTSPAEIQIEFPNESMDLNKNRYCEPIRTAEIAKLLPDAQTVLILFRFVRDDLLVLPIRRGRNGRIMVLADDDRLFSREDVKTKAASLVAIQQDVLAGIFAADSSGSRLAGQSAEEIVQHHGEMRRELYAEVYRTLCLDELLNFLEPDRELQRKLHLVLIPEGPLLGLPLHAAYCEQSGEYFFEQVASIRYTLSLRTLALQQDIAPPDCSHSELQGVVFASSSCPSKSSTQLECVRSEVDCLDETNPGRWMIHGDMGPSVADVSHFVRHHGAGNVLWFVGHGGPARDSIPCGRGRSLTVNRPALLLKDGALSDARMVAEGFDFRGVDLVNLSCCVLGSLNVPDTNVEIEGFLATMTLLGCRRVTSALWPLADKAAAEFAGHFIRALNRTALNGSVVRPPHAFALALKDAVQSFRSSRDGYFDHECYWAPYTLYGLG